MIKRYGKPGTFSEDSSPQQQVVNNSPTTAPATPVATGKPNPLDNAAALGNVIPNTKAPVLNPTENKTVQPNMPTFYQHGVSSIRIMQQKMIDLAKEISGHSIQNTPDREVAQDDTVTGAAPFMNFLVTNFMNNAKTVGQELVDTDVKQPTRMDTAKHPNNNFKSVLKSIMHIGSFGNDKGSFGNDKKPDGIWAERTTNALKQIYALAYSISQVQKEMFGESTNYTDDDLKQLFDAISAKTLEDKVHNAPFITKNLIKFEGLYDSFRNKVLDDPHFKDQISQAKPLLKMPAQKVLEISMTDEDKKTYEKHMHTPLSVKINNMAVTITPSDLLNIKTFGDYLNRNNSGQLKLTQEDLNRINKGDKSPLDQLVYQVVNNLSTSSEHTL